MFDTRKINIEGKGSGDIKSYNQKQIYHYTYNKSSSKTLDEAFSQNEAIRGRVTDVDKMDGALKSRYYSGISFSDKHGEDGTMIGFGGTFPITENKITYSDKKYTEGTFEFIGGSNDDTGEDHLLVTINGVTIVDMDLPAGGTRNDVFRSVPIPFISDKPSKIKIQVYDKNTGKPGAFGLRYSIKTDNNKNGDKNFTE